jgi:hypothetical protein
MTINNNHLHTNVSFLSLSGFNISPNCFLTSASNTGAFFRFRYFDIEKFQFRDSDINIGIGRLIITLATYKLESCIWYHFVRIGVLHMILHSKLRNFEISDNFFRICHFP